MMALADEKVDERALQNFADTGLICMVHKLTDRERNKEVACGAAAM
jgi:hypothetical protein